jgi:cystathionine beta-lyase
MTSEQKRSNRAVETIVTHGGRHPEEHHGYVNTPVYRGSTVIFQTLAELDDYTRPLRYGRYDSPTTQTVAELVSELEGASGTVLAPSGLAAISTALLAVLSAGDDVLITDSAYDPTRNFATEALARLGITARFYDPRIGTGIEELIRDNTKAIFTESPGSLTFEVQDLPAIAEIAHARGAAVIVDNSWASPVYFNPLARGADLVLHAGTKMFVGHSDVMIGTVSANAAWWPKLNRTTRLFGTTVSPDDAYLMARGMRTLAIRMKEHSARSIEMATWLASQPDVLEVYHPALPSNPGHDIWKRDFSGAGSLFAFRLAPRPRSAIAAMVDGFEQFSMGYSWGGYESLCIPFDPTKSRSATTWTAEGNMFRMHVGLEDIGDLKADIGAALERYRKAG